ncbi:hypothetical protein FRC18_011135 [Serendipita sp. 400]|nr:hypothetical protein FRC18_011135 [Serendipita sp. 400]
MSSFAALLAMSKAQSAVQDTAVQDALSQRAAKERAEREAAERRHQEELKRQAKIREAQAEQEKKDQERAKAREEAAKAKELEAQRKQKEEVDRVLGKSRHQIFEKRDRQANGGSHKKRRADDSDEGEGSTGNVLTRAEKRALRMDPDARPAWAQNLVGSSARSGSSTPKPSSLPMAQKPAGKHKKPQYDFGKSLNAPSSLSAQGDQNLSIRERIKGSDYLVPIKLAAVRRDTRTQADYFQEKRQRALAADIASRGEARHDSSSDSKGKGPVKGSTKSTLHGTTSKKPMTSPSKLSVGSGRHDSPSGSRKRRHSESLSMSDSDSDVPRKRSKNPSSGRSALSSQIWQIITGKDRGQYNDDIFSDEDDDMEVTAAEVEREEKRALAAARREDQIELEEQMRREAEKRRKKALASK